jgi:hypothetical protein
MFAVAAIGPANSVCFTDLKQQRLTLKGDGWMEFFKSFTGIKWAKGLDVSLKGELSPIGPIKSKTKSECFKLIFFDGQIVFAEWYKNGKLFGLKFFSYDNQDRVMAITLVSNGKIADSWHYIYSKKDSRKYKLISLPGKQPHSVTEYDAKGNKINRK